MKQQNPTLEQQNQQQDQQQDWVQILHNREQQRIRQYGSSFRLLSSDTNGGSIKENQSSYQWTISLNKLQPLQNSDSGLNLDKKLSTKSQFFQGQPPQIKRINQDFDEYKNKNLESIPQQEQLFRYHPKLSFIDQNRINDLLKRKFYIKEFIDNDNSQIVKILQINQMWQKNKLDNFNQNGFKRIAILIKRINIILNKKSKRKYLDLSYTNADSQLLKIIQNNLQQILYLNIQYCKFLDYLQLSGLSKLKNIKVSNSPIKTVKLQNLLNLYQFQAYMCSQLSEITFQKCPSVVKINVSSCSSLVSLISQHLQQLKKLNLNLCNRFIWDNILLCRKLYYFNAQGSNISTQYANIILQYNPNLQYINLNLCLQIKEKLNLKNNKSIQQLNISDACISQLNLHNLNKLEVLQLKCLNNLKQLVVKKCQNLKKLQFNGLNFDYVQLQENPSIQQIRFIDCFETESEQFQMKFKNMPQRIKIYFSFCPISQQLITLLQQLKKNHSKIQIFVNSDPLFDCQKQSQGSSQLSLNNMDIDMDYILPAIEIDSLRSASEDQEDIEDDIFEEILKDIEFQQ